VIRLTAVIELEGQGPRALTHESNAKTIILGRDADADFQVPLTTVSRQHARISESDNIYVIEDLGSTHGTMLNGKKLTKGDKKVLRDGDVVELTKAKITCNIEVEKVASADPAEGTQAIAARAVQGILGRLGDSAGEGPFVRVLSGPEEGVRFSLSGSNQEWNMGRAKDCEMVLNDPNVSRRHATIKKDWHGFTIHDLGSKNGVIVNERKIQGSRRLRDRDEITVGPVKLVFIDPDAELMSALSDVPGFETQIEPDAAELIDDDPSQLGAPDEEGDGLEMGAIGPPEPEEAPREDTYARIDPNLLDTEKRKSPVELVILAGASLVIVLCVLVLLYIL